MMALAGFNDLMMGQSDLVQYETLDVNPNVRPKFNEKIGDSLLCSHGNTKYLENLKPLL
jgi:hypothetical protein